MQKNGAVWPDFAYFKQVVLILALMIAALPKTVRAFEKHGAVALRISGRHVSTQTYVLTDGSVQSKWKKSQLLAKGRSSAEILNLRSCVVLPVLSFARLFWPCF
jgi:hypothetical protein